jgi:hypothetical protein
MTPCAVCTMHMKTMSASFLVYAQNQSRRFSGLGLKIDSFGSMIWASQSPRRFLGFSLKTKRTWVIGCTIKLMEGCRYGTHVEI